MTLKIGWNREKALMARMGFSFGYDSLQKNHGFRARSSAG